MTMKYLIAILFFALLGCKNPQQISKQNVENAIKKKRFSY